MDAALFTKMLSDKSVLDLKKLGYKYPQADMGEFVSLLKNGFYHPLPLKDFSGQALVYLNSVAQVHLSAARILLTPQSSTQLYGANAMEEEIISTFTIEQVDFSRDSVRKILSGFAPADESENRIYGMKKGLEFISDPANRITEASIHQLYETAIGTYLPEEDRLRPGSFYRHDSVYVVGSKVEHISPFERAIRTLAYIKISYSGSLPSVHARACGNEAVVTSLFLVKKRQSHPKVTLSQKHVVSSNRKEDKLLPLIKILRNYTSTIPYFLIMSTPFAGQIFRSF